MTQSAISQFAQDREAARAALRAIIDGRDDEGNPYIYPAQQRIQAAKELMAVDPGDNVGQELLAMELTDAQLVDIIARAQLAEQASVPRETVSVVPDQIVVPEKGGGATPSGVDSPISFAQRLAGIADLGAARVGELRVEDDPLCS